MTINPHGLARMGALAVALLVFQQMPLQAAEAGGMHMQDTAQVPVEGGAQGQTQPMLQTAAGGQSMEGMQPQGDSGPSSQAFAAANQKMHRQMAIAYTGNADVDFVRGMIPHHQGAIDMAKVELAYGSDPKIKALAERIVKAQEAEIAKMKAWLKKNGK